MNINTIDSQLTYLEETKLLLKDAIINKGQDIQDTDTFRSYADKIDQISTLIEETADATATADTIIYPNTAYVGGALLTGTIQPYSSNSPLELQGTYSIVDPINPNFILTKQNPRGYLYNDIMILPNTIIDLNWIKDKSFALRVYCYPNQPTNKYKLELDVAPAGSCFKYNSDPTGTGNNNMSIIAYTDSTGKTLTPFTIYICMVNSLDELKRITSTSWTKFEKTDTSTYSDKFGGVDYLFAYSSEPSIPNTSYGSTKGIPSTKGKLFIKDLFTNSTKSICIEPNTEIYSKIDQAAIASAIGLTSEMIMEGNTILGIKGTGKTSEDLQAQLDAQDELIASQQAQIEELKSLLADKASHITNESIETVNKVLGNEEV